MPLETASHISELNNANPGASDNLSQGDDHIRMLKAVLLNDFPGINAATTITPTPLNNLQAGIVGFGDGTSGAPTARFASETSLGWYRVSAGKMGLSSGKRVVGNGLVPVGSMHSFPKVPSNFLSGGTAGAAEYLECDGSVYTFADHPDLGAFLGSTFGGNGTTTFGVPNLKDTGRFIRSRTNVLAVGTSQTSVIKNHTHTFSGSGSAASDGAHTHTVNITDPGHTHTISPTAAQMAGAATTGPGAAVSSGATATQSNTTGITAATVSNGAHTHTVTISGTTDNNAGGDATETRPEAFAAIIAIKT
jgi:microcystin-dependent protein